MANSSFRTINFDITPPQTRAERIARLDALATLLDTAFLIPGTNIRFGLDALIGLVPGHRRRHHHADVALHRA